MAHLKDLVVNGNARVVGDLYANNISSVNWIYATCSTASATQVKEITIADNYDSPKDNDLILIYFEQSNSYNATTDSPVKFKIDNEEYTIWYRDTTTVTSNIPTGTNSTYYGNQYYYLWYRVDKTNKILHWIGHSWDSNSTYTPQALGFGYGTCTTASTTAAKAVTLSGYKLVTNGIIVVQFTYDVNSTATLNVNSLGAKKIFYRGVEASAGTIRAGDTVTFIYDGTQYHIVSIQSQRGALVGSDVASSDGWYKFATVTLNGNDDFDATLNVTSQFTNTYSGIYKLHLRFDGTDLTLEKMLIKTNGWLVRQGFDEGSIRLVPSKNVVNLYVHNDVTRYNYISFTEIDAFTGRKYNSDSRITYVYSIGNSAKETTEPSNTYSSTDIGTVAEAKNATTVNSLTVETAVPANAKFTDTTYSVATTSADGLMSSTDKTKLDAVDNTLPDTIYATCTTAAATQQKVITLERTNYVLKDGDELHIRFSYSNTFNATATTPITFKIGNDVYQPYQRVDLADAGTVPTGTNLWINGQINIPSIYKVDATNKKLIFRGRYWDDNSTYSPQSLGFGYGTCTTAAATVAKAVTLSGYVLVNNGIVSVKFTYAVPASATMNINGKGAKAIYYKGAVITAGVINAGDLATFMYISNVYHLIAIDNEAVGNRINITSATLDINTLNLSAGKPGIARYQCTTSGGAANITNIPVTGQPFILDVESIRYASATDYITRQRFISVDNVEWTRKCTNGTWSTWVKSGGSSIPVLSADPTSPAVGDMWIVV